MTPRFINWVICIIGTFWVDQVWKREDTCGCFAYDKYWTTITFPTVYANKNGYKDSWDRTFVCIHLYIYGEKVLQSLAYRQYKEMATHSSLLAWRIPGMGEPGGLLSVGLHRTGHDWSDLAAAAADEFN